MFIKNGETEFAMIIQHGTNINGQRKRINHIKTILKRSWLKTGLTYRMKYIILLQLKKKE